MTKSTPATARTSNLRKPLRTVAAVAIAVLALASCASTDAADQTVTTTVEKTVTVTADAAPAGDPAGTGSGEATETGAASDGTSAPTTADDAPQSVADCDAAADKVAEITASDNPSNPEFDALRDEIYAAQIDCRQQVVQTVDAVELATMMYQPDGGFTWYPESGELANHGFAVSVDSGAESLSSKLIEDITSLSPEEINDILQPYIAANESAEDWTPGTYAIGGWNNPKTGDVALDVSIIVDSAEDARQLGVEHDQIAAFDLQTMTSFNIDGTD